MSEKRLRADILKKMFDEVKKHPNMSFEDAIEISLEVRKKFKNSKQKILENHNFFQKKTIPDIEKIEKFLESEYNKLENNFENSTLEIT